MGLISRVSSRTYRGVRAPEMPKTSLEKDYEKCIKEGVGEEPFWEQEKVQVKRANDTFMTGIILEIIHNETDQQVRQIKIALNCGDLVLAKPQDVSKLRDAGPRQMRSRRISVPKPCRTIPIGSIAQIPDKKQPPKDVLKNARLYHVPDTPSYSSRDSSPEKIASQLPSSSSKEGYQPKTFKPSSIIQKNVKTMYINAKCTVTTKNKMISEESMKYKIAAKQAKKRKPDESMSSGIGIDDVRQDMDDKEKMQRKVRKQHHEIKTLKSERVQMIKTQNDMHEEIKYTKWQYDKKIEQINERDASKLRDIEETNNRDNEQLASKYEAKLGEQQQYYDRKVKQLQQKYEEQMHSKEHGEQEIVSALLPRLKNHHKKRKSIMKGQQTFEPLSIPGTTPRELYVSQHRRYEFREIQENWKKEDLYLDAVQDLMFVQHYLQDRAKQAEKELVKDSPKKHDKESVPDSSLQL